MVLWLVARRTTKVSDRKFACRLYIMVCARLRNLIATCHRQMSMYQDMMINSVCYCNKVVSTERSLTRAYKIRIMDWRIFNVSRVAFNTISTSSLGVKIIRTIVRMYLSKDQKQRAS